MKEIEKVFFKKVLKLPPFFPFRLGDGKRRQFQNSKFFNRVASFLYWLCSKAIQYKHNTICWKVEQFSGHIVNSIFFVDKLLWLPQISWTSIECHYFRGHDAVISTICWKNMLAVRVQWMQIWVNVHFFRGIQKSFPRTRTTITNKPFRRPRQGSLAVKNYPILYSAP